MSNSKALIEFITSTYYLPDTMLLKEIVMSGVKIILVCMFVIFSNSASADVMGRYLKNSKYVSYYAGWIHNKHKNINYSKALDISEEIIIQSSNLDIRPNILLALIDTESSFRTTAVSDKGAIGLTQVIPKYHKDLMHGRKLVSYRDAIFVGANVLKQYIVVHNGNIRRALKDYYGSRRENGDEYASKVLKLAYAVRTTTRYIDGG